MKEINYWEQFMATGKVEDFLAYKQAEMDTTKRERNWKKESGEHSHAVMYRGYGNDFKS